jgi:hypothetical protein
MGSNLETRAKYTPLPIFLFWPERRFIGIRWKPGDGGRYSLASAYSEVTTACLSACGIYGIASLQTFES